MTDYTTASAVKLEMGIGDSVDDTTIGTIITAVSAWIDEYCGRKFNVAVGQTRHYTATEDGEIVYIADATEITEVKTDDGSRIYSTTLLTTQYEAAPYNNPVDEKPYTKLYAVGGYRFPTGRRGVRVEAEYGWTAIPAMVVRACILQTQRLLRRKDAPFGVMGSPGAEMGQVMVIPKLDPDVMMLLATLRRDQLV